MVFAGDRRDQPRVRDIAPDDRLEAAALLPRRQRSDINAGEGRPLGRESVRQGLSALDALVHVVQHRAKRRIVDPPPQNVQRLDQRQTCLQQRRQFLIEDNELPLAWTLPAAQGNRPAAESAAAPQGENEQTLLFQLAP